mmetsp:Transcript_45829/g.118459  ORF Transcript_45829/g.118459 Transcript_45829/m.118459 type:complete len:224 (+) Transcript_45829:1069-1740(+)
MVLAGVRPCFSTAPSSLFTNSGSGSVPGKSWSMLSLLVFVILSGLGGMRLFSSLISRFSPGRSLRALPVAPRAIGMRCITTLAFKKTMDQLFPGTLPEPEFVKRLLVAVEKHGITPDNSIPIVGTCRDALASPLFEEFKRVYPGYFNIVSLAGLPQLGTIGLQAGLGHSPLDENGKERYLVLSLTHIGIDENGEPGRYKRPGREPAAEVCGALCALHHQIQEE